MSQSGSLVRSALLCALSFAPLAAQTPESVFNESCAMCHTIGGGDGAGPDLLPSTKWSQHELHEAIERMQENSGPLSEELIDGIADLLRDPAVKERLAGKAQVKSPLDDASPAEGRRLFFGEMKLQNGGAACFACHTVQGSGGTLAADLTKVYALRGEAPIIAAASKPAFPLMRGEYAPKPLTQQEALNIAAFLRETSAAQTAAPPASTLPLFGGASLAALALFVTIGFALGIRRTPNPSGGRS